MKSQQQTARLDRVVCRLAQRLLRTAACAMFVLGVLSTAGIMLTQNAVADERWFLLEFADSKPACTDVPEGSRCIGTRPKTTRFEILDGERIVMPTATPLPPAWAAFDQLWVYAPAATGTYVRRAIELMATPTGVRLTIYDGEYDYLQSIPLSRWTALEARNQPKLWVRVTPYSP